MKNLELQKCILGPVYTNCYLLKNKETGELIIVDPADCPEKIEMKISRMNGKPVAILLTHGHFDHILAAQAVKEKYNIPIYACRQEEEMLREPSINMTVHYGQGCSIVPDVFLEDLDVIRLAGFSVQMIHTPGHTKGSCCYYLPEEDTAIHKSVASFVGSSHRKKATAKTCYTKRSGTFLPQKDIWFTPVFSFERNARISFFELNDDFLGDHSALLQYADYLLSSCLQK